MIRNAHSARAFVAFLVTWSFVVLTVTGLVLYVVPHGRVANWTFWTLSGLGKDGWANVHILFGAVFIASGALHLWFNWKPFTRYLAERVRGHLALKQELVTSLAATALLVLGALWAVPPVSWVFDLNDRAKSAWGRIPGHEPPWARAEATLLPVLAERVGLAPEVVIAALTQAGIVVPSRDTTLEQLARAQGSNPAALFALITAPRPSPDVAAPASVGHGGTVDRGQTGARLAGSGIGSLTIAAFAAREGLTIDAVLARLRGLDIDATADDTLREIGARHGLRPIDLAKALLAADDAPGAGR